MSDTKKEQDAFINKNYNIVANIAKGFYRSYKDSYKKCCIDEDDLIQEAFLATLTSLGGFKADVFVDNPDKIIAYVRNKVHWRLIDILKKSSNEFVNINDIKNDNFYCNNSEDIESFNHVAFNQFDFDDMKKYLSKNGIPIIWKRYYEGKSYDNVAKDLGFSKKYVYDECKRNLERLRKAYGKYFK